ncbi:MAG TPA: DUF5700 domain-containing putative Zn-dependent protease [Symbiobacteriaceae bacterium]|nr:DUF5700 domain-containing putative Zn-dependent protease [Symbiobacteriaceae bacterium]
MNLDLTLVDLLLPILTDLSSGVPVTDARWQGLNASPTLSAVLENGRLTSLMEWRRIWEAAAWGEAPELGARQRHVLANARQALGRLEQVRTAAAALRTDLVSRMDEILRSDVLPNLPAGVSPAPAVALVLGIASGGGFFTGSGIYLDLGWIAGQGHDPVLLRKLLAHEIWHTGHYAALAPRLDQPWLGPVFQLQSEGAANYLIGGTREVCEIAAEQGDERASAFVTYADTFEPQARKRLREYAEALEMLLTGDEESYQAYERTLPDMPGYLHGVYMCRAIDAALGREALIATLPDPVSFLLRYQEAAEKAQLPLLPKTLVERLGR